MENKDYTEWVENYLAGQLSTQEANAFEVQLESDQTLRDEYDFQLTFNKAFENISKGDQRLKDHVFKGVFDLNGSDNRKDLPPFISEIREEIEQDRKGKTNSQNAADRNLERGKIIPLWARQVIRVAAVLILIVGAFWLFSLFQTQDPQTLALNELKSPYDIESNTRSGQEDPDYFRLMESFQNNYRAGEYGPALSDLETLINSGKAGFNQYFYAGLCNLYKTPPDYQAAIAALGKANSPDYLFQDEVLWYQSIAHILTGNELEASEYLKVLAARQGVHKEEAAKLLELLGE